MHDRLSLRIALVLLPALGCATGEPTTEATQPLADDDTPLNEPGDVVAPDPEPSTPDACANTGLTRCASKLRWNTGAAQLVGYSDFDVVTRNGFDRIQYLRDVRPFVNLQRIWASGYSNTGPGCTGPCCPFTETLPWTVTGTHGGVPIYDLWSFAATYNSRLTAVLNEATADDGVVELTLFDHWALMPARFGVNPWNPANNNLDAHGCRKLDAGAFPAFYQIFEADGSTLNCLGQRQKAYVDHVMSIARTHHNIVFEVMNEAGSAASNAELKKWHRTVAGWVTAQGAQFPIAASLIDASRAGDPMTPAETSIFGAAQIGLVNLHYKEWRDDTSGPGEICNALRKFATFGKPIVIDDDGAGTLRDDVTRMFGWADRTINGCGLAMGTKHFNHKGPIDPACRNDAALRKLGTLPQTP